MARDRIIYRKEILLKGQRREVERAMVSLLRRPESCASRAEEIKELGGEKAIYMRPLYYSRHKKFPHCCSIFEVYRGLHHCCDCKIP
jgi:hypothetical protein